MPACVRSLRDVSVTLRERLCPIPSFRSRSALPWLPHVEGDSTQLGSAAGVPRPARSECRPPAHDASRGAPADHSPRPTEGQRRRASRTDLLAQARRHVEVDELWVDHHRRDARACRGVPAGGGRLGGACRHREQVDRLVQLDPRHRRCFALPVACMPHYRKRASMRRRIRV